MDDNESDAILEVVKGAYARFRPSGELGQTMMSREPRVIAQWLEAALIHFAAAHDSEEAEFRMRARWVVDAWRGLVRLPAPKEFEAHSERAIELGLSRGLRQTLAEFHATQGAHSQFFFVALQDRSRAADG